MYTTRPAESGDFELLFAAYARTRALQAQASESEFDPVDARRSFAAIFRDCDLQVIESGGAMIGALGVRTDEDPVELVHLEVAESVQGCGWGTLLVSDVIRLARRRNRDVVVTLERSNPARRLFERLGFERIDEDDDVLRLRWSGSEGARLALKVAAAPWSDPSRAGPWLARQFDDSQPLVAFVTFIAGRAELGEGPRVLEIGCGYGLRLPAWARLGGPVTGIEGRGAAAAAAARVASRLGPRVRVSPGNALEIAESQPYDLVLWLDGELARLLTAADRRAAARNVRASVRPGGVLVVTLPNGPVSAARTHPSDPRTLRGPLALVSRIPRFDVDLHEAQVLRRDTDVVERHGHEVAVVEHEDRQALLDRPAVIDLLQDAGFVGIETFTDLDSTAVGRAVRECLILVARVPTFR